MTLPKNSSIIVEDGPTILSQILLRYSISSDTAGVAVALNLKVIPRMQWDTTEVQVGDEIEVLSPFEGG